MQAVEPLMSSSVQLPFIASSSHQPPFCALVPSSSCHCQLCTCLSGVGAVAQARMDVYSSAPFFGATILDRLLALSMAGATTGSGRCAEFQLKFILFLFEQICISCNFVPLSVFLNESFGCSQPSEAVTHATAKSMDKMKQRFVVSLGRMHFVIA
eukprot:1157872-Pelagomonas_calceolata.AAC.2